MSNGFRRTLQPQIWKRGWGHATSTSSDAILQVVGTERYPPARRTDRLFGLKRINHTAGTGYRRVGKLSPLGGLLAVFLMQTPTSSTLACWHRKMANTSQSGL